ncbi:hypothetical protein CRG98_025784 [Punica granatum]|uniref:Uncharacterized protein n=1 Tax=Punica granatum TaxID=22663 RepID=A0A2I0JC67_PUNGR|nr:hypothetical protein CRG98_025784 [Punica granatum]
MESKNGSEPASNKHCKEELDQLDRSHKRAKKIAVRRVNISNEKEDHQVGEQANKSKGYEEYRDALLGIGGGINAAMPIPPPGLRVDDRSMVDFSNALWVDDRVGVLSEELEGFLDCQGAGERCGLWSSQKATSKTMVTKGRTHTY